ncbi:hypothetical protein CW304_19675 [Bacillus sp. UFRGS-B20]|nr:hypothetical protein CW304_19675 [Bacillus sp. UFRGS-B20]
MRSNLYIDVFDELVFVKECLMYFLKFTSCVYRFHQLPLNYQIYGYFFLLYLNCNCTTTPHKRHLFNAPSKQLHLQFFLVVDFSYFCFIEFTTTAIISLYFSLIIAYPSFVCPLSNGCENMISPPTHFTI